MNKKMFLEIIQQESPEALIKALDDGAGSNEEWTLGRFVYNPISYVERKFAKQDLYQAFEALLKKGANPNAMGVHDRTVLQELVAVCDTDLVELFLQYNADLNAPSLSGGTAMMVAINAGFKEPYLRDMFDVLIDKTDLSIKDNTGKTALDYAKANNYGETYPKIFSLIQENLKKDGQSEVNGMH